MEVHLPRRKELRKSNGAMRCKHPYSTLIVRMYDQSAEHGALGHSSLKKPRLGAYILLYKDAQ
jgi:hypothetical protein